LLLLHKASFIAWLAVMSLHVLGHLLDTARLAPRDWLRRTRRQIDGAGTRQWALAASLALGLVLALLVVPKLGPWLVAGIAGHG
jgi:cytochrome c biogenesis protein CcdA